MMKLVSQLRRIALFIFVLVAAPVISLSQDLPGVPNVFSRTIFEFQGKTYIVEIEPGKGAHVAKGSRYCANPDERPQLECKNCSLVLKLGQREVSRISLGSYTFVYDQGEWRVTGRPPIDILTRKADLPLIVLSEYRGCNGNYHKFYSIDVQNGPTLKPLKFVGLETGVKDNQVYGSSVRFVETSRFYQRELWVGGYDNANTGSFLIQFAESSPGQWSCIGFYTQAGGGLQEMEKKLLGK
jgi:hypothetical protein